MGDQLENFVLNNRSEFDNSEPSGKVWSKIDEKLDRKGKDFTFIWKVAAILFLASTIVLLLNINSHDNTGPMLDQEFMEIENYYITMISQRKAIVEGQLTKAERTAFLNEIESLDTMYLELKKTYQTNAANERVVDALINNLRLRLEILNRQLEILENIKGHSNEKEPSIEI